MSSAGKVLLRYIDFVVRLDRRKLLSKTLAARFYVDFLEFYLSGHQFALPVLISRLNSAELRHHFFGEQLEAFADIVLRVVARLVEQNDPLDVAAGNRSKCAANNLIRSSKATL